MLLARITVYANSQKINAHLRTSITGFIFNLQRKDAFFIIAYHTLEKFAGFVALLKNAATRAGHLCYTDTNICLLQSHDAAKLSHVRRTMDPASQMW